MRPEFSKGNTIVPGIALLIFLSVTAIFGQGETTPLRGKLRLGDGSPIAYANIFIEGTSLGTMSDENGLFQLDLPLELTSASLIVSYIGYEELNVALEDKKNLENLVLTLSEEKSIRNDKVFVYAQKPALKSRGIEKDFMELLVTEADGSDLIEASSKMPGSQKKDNDSRIYLRGGEFYETRFVADGAYLLNPYLTNTGFGAIGSYIDATDANTYVFSSGGFSSKYTGALSGIVEIRSKNFRKNWYSTSIAALQEGVAINREMPLGDRVGLSFNVYAFDQDSYYQTNKSLFSTDEELDVFSDHPKGFAYKGRLDFDLGKGNHLKLSGASSRSEYEYKIRTVEDVFGLAAKEENLHLNALYSGFPINKLGLESNVAYSTYNTNSSLLSTDWQNRSVLMQWNTNANYYFNEKNDLQFGMNVHRYNLATEQYFVSDGDAGFQTDLASGTDQTILQSGIFADYRWQFNKKVGVNIGGRTELTGETLTIDPRASAYVQDGNWIYKLSCGRYSQLPQARYYAAVSDADALLPERSTHLMLDAEYEDPQRKLYAGLYFKNYSSLIVGADTVLASQGGGEAIGADFRVNIKTRLLGHRVQYSFTTSFLRARKRFRSFLNKVPAPTDVPMSNYFFMKFYFDNNTHLGIIHYQSLGRPYSDSSERLQNRRLPRTHSSSIYGLIQNRLSDWDLFTYISLDNIFGVRNIYGYAFNQDFTQRIPQYSGGIRTITIAVSISK